MPVWAAAAAVIVIVAAAAAVPAAGSPSCGQAVLDAWAAGTLGADRLPTACYRQALDEMPADMAGRSSAPDDVEQALRVALARQQSSAAGAAIPVHPLLVASGGLLAATVAATIAVRLFRR